MTQDTFAAPGTATGFEMSEHLGHLVVIEVKKLEEGIVTTNGVRDAIRGTIHDIDAAETHEDAMIWGKVLVISLSNRIGQKVLGRIAQGNAKPGQKPPWLLDDESGNADSVARATAYLTGQVAKTLAAPATATPAPAPAVAVPGLDMASLTPEQAAAIAGLLGQK